MTKQETIIKAWIDLGIKTPFGICDNSGYFHGYFCNGLDEILEGFGLKENQIDFDIDFDGIGKFRPKSLKGIETNNGWNKIESVDDLPKDNNLIWVMIEDFKDCINAQPDVLNDDYYGSDGVIYHGRHITHYQNIVKPNNPLY